MPNADNALANLLELHAIVKRKREIALDGGKFRQRFVTHLPQIVLVEPVEKNLADENILPKLARRSHIGMKLPKLARRSCHP